MPKSAPKKSVIPKSKSKPAVQRPVKPTVRMKLPGMIELTTRTITLLRRHRSLMLRLIMFGWVISVAISGLAYLGYYSDLSQSTDEVSGQLATGILKTSAEVGALIISLMSGGAASLLTESQQMLSFGFYLVLWLVIIWLLRHIMAGAAVRFRDGLYNATTPLIPTMVLVTIACLQLLPLALLVSFISAIAANGVITGVWWMMVIVVLFVLLAAAFTLYWLVSTLFALIVVTIPGTYPIAALRSASKIISGYRRALLGRVLGLAGLVLFTQVILMLPVIAFDALVGYQLSLFVVLVYLLVSVKLFVFASAYLYVLYREVIDERS